MKIVVNELIPVYETEKGERVANGRELHQFLDVATRYNDWAKSRIEKYGFIDGEDFATVTENLVSGGKQNTHIFKIDTAKELCMVENNENGSKARKYFIEIEKRFKNQPQEIPSYMIEDPIQRATKWIEEATARKQLETKIEADREKVHFAESLQISPDSILIGELAKLLKQNGIDIGGLRLFQLLRKEGYLMKQGEQYNMPTQRSMELGIMEVKTGSRQGSEGAVHITRTTKITGKGQAYFINKFKKLLIAN